MSGHTSFSELRNMAYRRWYQFGWRSPVVLYKRARFRHWPFRLRMAWQRARRGYSDEQLWGLNFTVAKLTVLACCMMRENAHSYPTEFSEEPVGDGRGWEAWEEILLKIEAGFQAWLDEDGYVERNPEQEAKFKEAMELYGEWFGGLWD